MSQVIFLTEDQAELIREINAQNGAAVVVMPEMKEEAEKAMEEADFDGDLGGIGYDFGGESDLVVDVVFNSDHYFFEKLKEEE